MEIVITGRHTEVSERFREQTQEKLTKVSQLAPKAQRVDVEVSQERNPRQAATSRKVEITVRDRGPVIRAEAVAEDPYAALDLALAKLLERLRRSRDRRKVHHGRQTPPSVRTAALDAATVGAVIAPVAEPSGPVPPGGSSGATGADLAGAAPVDVGAPDADEGGIINGAELQADGFSPVVIRTKDHEAVPMTLDQALYEMELVGHDFFLFMDAESGRPSVVYRRRGWNYGLIRLTMTEPVEEAAPVREYQSGAR